jgi:hypothetical protein
MIESESTGLISNIWTPMICAWYRFVAAEAAAKPRRSKHWRRRGEQPLHARLGPLSCSRSMEFEATN